MVTLNSAPPQRLPRGDAGEDDTPVVLARTGRLARVVGQTLLALLAAAALVVLAPLTPHPGAVTVAGVTFGLGSVLAGAAADRAGRRRDLMRATADALADVVGKTRRQRVRLTAYRWGGGWVGHPGKMVLRYRGRANSDDPAWTQAIVSACQRRIGIKYTVASHDRQLCRLVIVVDTAVPEEAPQVPPLQQRASDYLTQVMGPTARVQQVQWSQEDPSELVGFVVAHENGAKLSAAGYQRRVEQVVNSTLPGRWKATWDMEADQVTFALAGSFPESVWMPVCPVDEDQDVLSSYDEVEIPYGVDENGEEMVWRPAIDPNMLLVGAPGTGKTVTAHGILVGFARRGWPVWVLDGKMIEFLGFRDWPNVQVVATGIEEQVAMLYRAHEVMDTRYKLVTAGQASETDFEPLAVILDEWADFRGNSLHWYATIKQKGDPSAPPWFDLLAALLRKARSSRVHVLLGTQRPDAIYFAGDMRDNMRMRVSMGRLSPQGATMMWQNPYIGTQVPQGRRGRATTINRADRAVEIQTYRTPDPRKATTAGEVALLDQLRPPVARHPRMLIVPPQHRMEWDKKAEEQVEVPLDYRDYAAAEWVPAAERPDLDPLNVRPSAEPVQVSPTALFASSGTTSPLPEPRAPGTTSAHPTQPATPVTPPAGPSVETPEDDSDPGGEEDGYGPGEEISIAEVEPGFLVLVDDQDAWGVVEDLPEPDPMDPDLLCVSWCDDQGGAGTLSEDTLTVRRPLDAGAGQ